MPAATLTVFDLEFTAWKSSMATHWLRPGEFKEVVQIGALKLDARDFAVLDTLDILVRPRINPDLSDYFENLTGITNAQVQSGGIDFVEAYGRFVDFSADGPICAFGRDDGILNENIRFYGLTGMAALPEFFDLCTWFAAHSIDPRGMLSCEMGPALGVPFEGRLHNALDDARSLACAMQVLVARGATAQLRPAA